jgi:hypothetical protein
MGGAARGVPVPWPGAAASSQVSCATLATLAPSVVATRGVRPPGTQRAGWPPTTRVCAHPRHTHRERHEGLAARTQAKAAGSLRRSLVAVAADSQVAVLDAETGFTLSKCAVRCWGGGTDSPSWPPGPVCSCACRSTSGRARTHRPTTPCSAAGLHVCVCVCVACRQGALMPKHLSAAQYVELLDAAGMPTWTARDVQQLVARSCKQQQQQGGGAIPPAGTHAAAAAAGSPGCGAPRQPGAGAGAASAAAAPAAAGAVQDAPDGSDGSGEAAQGDTSSGSGTDGDEDDVDVDALLAMAAAEVCACVCGGGGGGGRVFAA